MSRFSVFCFATVMVPETWRQGVTLGRLLVCRDDADDDDGDVDGDGASGTESRYHAVASSGL